MGVLRLFIYFLTRRDKKWFLILSLVSAFSAILEVVAMGLFVPVVAGLTNEGVLADYAILKNILQFLEVETFSDILIPICFILIGLFIFKNILYILVEWLSHRYSFYIARTIGVNLMRTYLSCSYAFRVTKRTDLLLRNVTSEISQVYDIAVFPLIRLVSNSILCITLISFLIYLDYILFSILSVVIFITFYLFNKILQPSLAKQSKIVQEEQGIQNQSVIQAFQGFKETKLFGFEPYILDQYYRSLYQISLSRSFTNTVSASNKYILETVVVITILILMAVALQQDAASGLLVSLSIFGLSMFRLLPSLGIIFSGISSLQQGKVTLDLIYKEMQEATSSIQQRTNTTRIPFKKEITLRRVVYAYPSNPQKNVLQEVSMSIAKNKTIGIVGTSGSGKTTLVDVLSGLLMPLQGEVCIDGQLLKDHSKGWWVQIGYVPQQIYLIDGSIQANIAFGLPSHLIDKVRVRQVLNTANLGDFVDSLEEKENTEIGENGIRLSGGQRQRIGIARALYHNPSVLIMDEATSALDNISEKQIMQAIEKLTGELTIIIIAHRLTTIQKCDQVFVLDQGKVVDSGTYDTLSTTNSILKRMIKV